MASRLKTGGGVLGLILAALVAYEGFSPTPYQDQAGVWTNGYGNTVGVTAKTPPLTHQQAEQALVKHTESVVEVIDRCLTRPATEGQTVAYTSLAYNIGNSAFCKSTVVRRHNAGDTVGACNAILMWNKITVKGKLVVNRGLENRRKKEQAYCLRKD